MPWRALLQKPDTHRDDRYRKDPNGITADRRKTPSMVWMCPDCGKRGTVFSAVEDDGRVAGYFYECPNGHCWDRPYDD